MLSVEEATQRILAQATVLATEYVPIMDALGRALAEDIQSAHNMPPFANSAMDGYAVIADDVQHSGPEKPVKLQVIEDIPAGHTPQQTVQAGQAARIMTGAPLPSGANAVVPVEITDDTRRNPQLPTQVGVFQPVESGANVRLPGEDIQAGAIVLRQGRRLRPADLGVLASLGIAGVPVVRRPRVAVISTGDELLTPDQPLEPGKIRDSNGYVIPALVMEAGGRLLQSRIARDNLADVRAAFQQALDQRADLLITTAGVSVGTYDVVRTVLEEFGQLDFWKVNMRPGKPLTFGHIGDTLFLGLPGNPVSAMVTFMVFVRPLLARMQGLDSKMHTRPVRLGEAMTSDGRMTFARVRLEREGGEWVAYATGTQSSGALSSMVKADGLLIIPAGTTQINVGQTLEVWPLDSVQ